jgi:uncharacterized protein YcbX
VWRDQLSHPGDRPTAAMVVVVIDVVALLVLMVVLVIQMFPLGWSHATIVPSRSPMCEGNGVRVASLHTYPIKGCYRFDHERVEVEPWGMAGDRRWCVVDPSTGEAITQRDNVGLTRIRPEPLPGGGGLLLRTPGQADLTVAEPDDGESVEISVWSFTGRALRAGAAADDWLSSALDQKVRLVWLADTSQRMVEPLYAAPGDRVSFADGYPVLLGNLGSLASLNDLIAESGSLEGPLPMTRFRPNVVIDDAPAWTEDGWLGGRVRIGEVVFRVPKPCDRCVVTTTDQETGQRGREPLRTLGRHRNINQKLLFATNLIPDARGWLSVGDAVEPI